VKREFYDLLEKNEDFCCALGKVILVASKLEILLKQYLKIFGKGVSKKKATLGNLIKILEENNHLTENGEICLRQAVIQRNYLIHDLYGSFVDEIEKKLLPVDDLFEEDIEIYTEKVNGVFEDFNHYAKIVQSALEKHSNQVNGLKPALLI